MKTSTTTYPSTMERACILNIQVMGSFSESSLTLARTVNKCHLGDRHTLMKTETIPSAYVNVKIIKYTKKIALTYISCDFHRNAAFVGA